MFEKVLGWKSGVEMSCNRNKVYVFAKAINMQISIQNTMHKLQMQCVFYFAFDKWPSLKNANATSGEKLTQPHKTLRNLQKEIKSRKRMNENTKDLMRQ